MHEFKLVADVLKEVLKRCEGKGVEVVRLKVGEDCHARPDNIEYLFCQASRGTRAESAKIEIKMMPGADLVLESIRVE
jgi:Zn finger protein HypA/HybF involved in hydrogenase expression